VAQPESQAVIFIHLDALFYNCECDLTVYAPALWMVGVFDRQYAMQQACGQWLFQDTQGIYPEKPENPNMVTRLTLKRPRR
jgi:hypothetical protein